MRIVSINSKLWAIGLQWIPPNLKRKSRSELARIASDLDQSFSIMAKRRQQVGFASIDDTHNKNTANLWKIRSLSAFLPDFPSFIGTFTLRDVNGELCWWVFARLHGLNLGTGDQVFDTYEEANTEANVLRDLQKSIFAEDVYCATEGESIDWLSKYCKLSILDYFTERAMLTPLRGSVPPNKALSVLAIGIVVVSLGGYAIKTFLEYQEQQQRLEYSRQQALAEAQQKQQIVKHPEDYFTQEWQTQPLASQQAQVCVKGINDLPTVMNGWNISSATCSKVNISITWEHELGANFINLPQKTKLISPKVARTSVKLDYKLKPRSKQPYTSLANQDTLKRFFYEICQNTSSKLRLKFLPPETVKVDKVDVSSPWLKGTWELSNLSYLAISTELIYLLEQFSGITLDSVVWKNNTWIFKGRVFAISR